MEGVAQFCADAGEPGGRGFRLGVIVVVLGLDPGGLP
eukprot:CAMPEP_0204368478 /NCGR_PEP_ID=MMETSP0469-20131031/44211_1 /ASSEMBLY_ACC=CAM_ASM_000384 /TAXON_ID=2969 /ORGANISM="Oxyrrhis marina" /LENGTH=36 /DNA_ID= /DNA_START= /DNA_END= /DNA_ORIENTATION=